MSLSAGARSRDQQDDVTPEGDFILLVEGKFRELARERL